MLHHNGTSDLTERGDVHCEENEIITMEAPT